MQHKAVSELGHYTVGCWPKLKVSWETKPPIQKMHPFTVEYNVKFELGAQLKLVRKWMIQNYNKSLKKFD